MRINNQVAMTFMSVFALLSGAKVAVAQCTSTTAEPAVPCFPPASVLACENTGRTSVSCPAGTTIDVHNANYGRTNTVDCPGGFPPGALANANCFSSNVQEVIRASCQGRASCTVGSSTGELNFGTDPCGGTYKFLEFQYTCVEEDPEVLFELVCEGMTLALSCSDGQRLNIISANYGRTASDVCVAQRPDELCFAEGSLDIVRNMCQGQTSCSVPASNPTFEDPCNGVFKYLEASYTCI